MTSKILETYQYIYFHLHNFCVFNMGYFVLCCPTFYFWFQSISFHSSISFLNHTCFVPKLPASVTTAVFFKQAQQSLYNMLQERRTETSIQRKGTKKMGSKQ